MCRSVGENVKGGLGGVEGGKKRCGERCGGK